MKNLLLTIWAACLAIWLWTGRDAGAAVDFERYQPILDRSPFGEVSPLPAVSADIGTGELLLADTVKEYEMKGIIEDGNRLRVAFLNKSTGKYVYLREGEELDGVRLLSVNYEQEEAKLQMGGQTMLMRLRPDRQAANVMPEQIAVQPPPSSLGGEGAGWVPAAGGADTAQSPFGGRGRGRRRSPFQQLGTNEVGGARSLEFFFKPNTNAGVPFFSPFRPQSGTDEGQPSGGGTAPPPFPFTPITTNAAPPFQPFTPSFQTEPETTPAPWPIAPMDDSDSGEELMEE